MTDKGGTFDLTSLPAVSDKKKKKVPDGLRLDEYDFGSNEKELKSPEVLSPVQVRKYFGEAARDRFRQRQVHF